MKASLVHWMRHVSVLSCCRSGWDALILLHCFRLPCLQSLADSYPSCYSYQGNFIDFPLLNVCFFTLVWRFFLCVTVILWDADCFLFSAGHWIHECNFQPAFVCFCTFYPSFAVTVFLTSLISTWGEQMWRAFLNYWFYMAHMNTFCLTPSVGKILLV